MSRQLVATGLSRGGRTSSDHASHAVSKALERVGLSHANGVLLFLTPDFASNPEPALRAAARAAGCTQVIGCTGAGVLTDQEWVLDSPPGTSLRRDSGHSFHFKSVHAVRSHRRLARHTHAAHRRSLR